MHRRKLLDHGLVTLLVLVTVGLAFKRSEFVRGVLIHGIGKASSITPSASSEQPLSDNDNDANIPAAPEFAPGTWINSEPLTLKSLRGRVVLVDFWTFACYNCRNTLPHVKAWDTKYRDKGLAIIGVHSPELDEERVIDNVRRETAALGISYPVVTDNDYATWRSYNVEAWPTVFLLDKQGRIRWTHVGEGAYEETEKMIRRLLADETKPSAVKTSAAR